MRKYLNGLKANHLAVALAAAGLCNATLAGAETKPDFTNPAVGMSSEAVIAEGALASWMMGKPEEFAKNLKYAQEDLTTNTVLRYRAAP